MKTRSRSAHPSLVIAVFLSWFGSSLFASGSVRLNEIVAANSTTIADEDGSYEDWIELHNDGDAAVDLSGWGLSDDSAQPFRWVIPDGTSLGAGGFLLIWASAKDRATPGSALHTNFNIGLTGARVLLTSSGGILTDQLPPTLVPNDISVGRVPGGGDTWFFFDEPTPEGHNLTTAYASVLDPVEFSHQGGFHETDFELFLSHPDPESVIIYTLDGSTPDPGNLGGTTYQYKNVWPHRPGDPFGPFLQNFFVSHTYDAPISIVNRSGEPDKLTQISSTWHQDPSYLPSSPVYKGTVVQARAYKPGSLPSYSSGHTYFVDPNGNPFSHPILSLQVQEDLLFGYEKGIYTAGADFDTWRQNNPNVNAGGTEHWTAPYNWQRGSSYQLSGTQPRDSASWEYPARLEFFEPDGGNAGINQGIGFRIHGNASRGLRSKSLRLYARSRYDSANEMSHRVFPWDVPFAPNAGNDKFKRILVRGPGSGGPFMNEWTVHKLMEGHYEGVTRVRNAVQFINGEYWGLTALRDRFDEHHVANHFNLEPENVIITSSRDWNEDHGIDAGVASDLNLFAATRSFILNENMADDSLYRQAEDMICMRSYIDHLIPNIYFGNTHFENGFWRARVPSDDGFGDGRWRVYVQDFEYSLASGDYLGTAYNNLAMFRNLLDNPEFQNRFINRFADLINTAFAPERVESLVLNEYASLASDLAAHQHRWNVDYFLYAYPWEPHDSRHLRSLSDMINYANAQPTTQRERIRSRFGISGDAEVTLAVSDATQGHVRVNTMEIRSGAPGVADNPYPWTGVYFNGVPIELEAIAEDGYRLAGWVTDVPGAGLVTIRDDLGQGQFQLGSAEEGGRPFTDEEITITSLPPELAGKVVLRTANSDATWLAEGEATSITEIEWSYTDAIPDLDVSGNPLAGANTTLADGSGAFQSVAGTTAGGDEWGVRTPFGNSGSILQAFGGGSAGPQNTRELKTTIRGLAPGVVYPVSSMFWRDGSPWTIRAGLSYGNDQRENELYNPNHPSVFEAATLDFSPGVLTEEGNRVMLAAFLGNAVADVNGEIDVFVHDVPTNQSSMRTWYDGVAVGSEPFIKSGTYLAFEVDRASTVYVINDPSSEPAWLTSGFTSTGLTVDTTAGTLAVWEKSASAGELIVLPGKGGDFTDSNYWVVLDDGAEEEFFSTDPVISLSLTESTQVKAVFEPVPLAELPIALHFWNFDNSGTFLAPSYTIGGGALDLLPGPSTAVIPDTGADFPTQHLRVNNPLGSTLAFSLPTTGYSDIALEFPTRRSGQGAGLETLSYTTDGQIWSELQSFTVFDSEPQIHRFDFGQIPGASDNPAFAVRITFEQGEGSIAGNNRFDDVVLWGVGLPETVLPPMVNEEAVPERIVMVSSGDGALVDLQGWFIHPNGVAMTYQVSFPADDVLAHSIDGSALTLSATRAGGVTVTVQADDGVNPPVPASFAVLIYPEPLALAEGNFLFQVWSPAEPAGSFPPNMLFLQSDISDPGLTADLSYVYHIPPADAAQPADVDFPYAAGSRTRINGRGADGISFINTGRGRDLGSAVLALDTTGAGDIELTWTAGTISPNSREYRLRLQYRVGIDSEWADLPGTSPLEYIRNVEAGHEMVFGPVGLPAALEGHPNLQLQWRYYHESGTSGSRAEIRLDDILVTSAAHRGETFSGWLSLRFPDLSPEESDPSEDPFGQGIPLLIRYGLDDGEAGEPTLPSLALDGDTMALRFRRDPAKMDIAYIVEASGDLGDWSEVLYDSRVDLFENNDGDSVRIVDPVTITSGASQRFLRLRVILLE